MNAKEYIISHLHDTLRKKGRQEGARSLPYSYTAPCANGLFDDLYYWDTYFFNKALLLEGEEQRVRDNILDFCFLIEQYGFIPNSANFGMVNRTQVPYFILMCDEYLSKYPSVARQKRLFPYRKKEYEFWMANRLLPCGLNHYSGHADDHFLEEFSKVFTQRVHTLSHPEFDLKTIGHNAIAECESGWDFSSRFDQRCVDFAPVDLNALLYINEGILAKYSNSPTEKEQYLLIQKKRKENRMKYRYKDGLFFDYDTKNEKTSSFYHCGMFYPFLADFTFDKNAFEKLCSKLIYPKGIAASEKIDNIHNYQWEFPNRWPNLAMVSFFSCLNVKENELAKEIGLKYLSTVEEAYLETGCLWEKYDVLFGGKSRKNEYQDTERMGWTAGTYLVLESECRRRGWIHE